MKIFNLSYYAIIKIARQTMVNIQNQCKVWRRRIWEISYLVWRALRLCLKGLSRAHI
jgi:hypothetical protein